MAARRRTGNAGTARAGRTLAAMNRMAMAGKKVRPSQMAAARQAIANARASLRRAGSANGLRQLRNASRRVGAGTS